jgi:phosphatidylglycerol:prolipoprotein diacylglycerol transferase
MSPRPVSWLPGALDGLAWSAYDLHLALALGLGLALVLFAPSLRRVARPRLFVVYLAAGLVGLLGSRWLPWLAAGFPPFDEAAHLQRMAYAGVASGLVATYLSARLLSVPRLPLLDALAPAGALGLAVARVGCFLSGCDFGVPSAAWVTVRYPAWALPGAVRSAPPALADHATRALVEADAPASLPIHPVQLYEALLALALFAALTRLGPRRDALRPLVLAVGYGLGRFLLELLRGDADRGVRVFGTPWSASQCVSIAVVAGAIAALARRRRSMNPLS